MMRSLHSMAERVSVGVVTHTAECHRQRQSWCTAGRGVQRGCFRQLDEPLNGRDKIISLREITGVAHRTGTQKHPSKPASGEDQ